MVLGSNVQVVWEKFCRYWDVEARYVPITHDRYTITPETMLPFVDENTIGVVAILGTTFTGEYEPIKEIAEALTDSTSETGWNVPMHVDAASGGSSPRSCSPTSSGTSGCRSSSPSTCRATSTG